MRDWSEVNLNNSSYFTGKLFGDCEKRLPDGSKHTTGIITIRLDRGDYWLAKTSGPYAYMLFKKQERK